MVDIKRIKDIGQCQPRPTYYTAKQGGGKITVPLPPRIPIGMTLPIARGWGRGLEEGMAFETLPNRHIVDPSGRGRIDPATGRFTLDGAAPRRILAREPMVGRVYSYNPDGTGERLEADVLLPSLQKEMVLDRVDRLESTIEVVPVRSAPGQPTPDKLELVERVRANTGLPEDKSKIVYYLSPSAVKRIQQEIIDVGWIDHSKTRIDAQGNCRITYTHPVEGGARVSGMITLSADDFVDNQGHRLLGNKKAGLTRPRDIYQSAFPTEETRPFQPRIDIYHGQLCLVVNRVRRRTIDMPTGFKVPDRRKVKIFPAAADAAVRVGDGYIPITLREHLKKLEDIDPRLSQIVEGIIKHAIGPQIKLGEGDNFSGDYPRDIYFYGTALLATLTVLENWGENFAINRGKAIRALGAIHSGRTHVMGWELVFNSFADLMETNNEFFDKVSNFGEEFNSPGVSEDAQMEMQYRLRNLRMWVSQEICALMKAEKEHSQFTTQNADRYNYSEALFVLAVSLAKIDILLARFGHRGNVLFSWADMAEKLAGRTWYKWALNKNTEVNAIPVYLYSPLVNTALQAIQSIMGSIFNVQVDFGGALFQIAWYPVDLTLFAVAWGLRTVASGINYAQHLWSLGFDFLTGFWRNPSYELTYLKGYTQGALTQSVYRNQFGDFSRTAEAGGGAVPKPFIVMIRRYAINTTLSLAVATFILSMGGLVAWLAFPFGVVGAVVGFSALKKGLASSSGWKKTLAICGGTFLATAGGLFAITGISVLGAAPISIAVIANVLFGSYSFGMMAKGLVEMYKAIRAAEKPLCQVAIHNGKAYRGVLVAVEGEAKTALLAFIASNGEKYHYDEMTSYFFMAHGPISPAEAEELGKLKAFDKKANKLKALTAQSHQPLPLQRYRSEKALLLANDSFETMRQAIENSCPLHNRVNRTELLAEVPEIESLLGDPSVFLQTNGGGPASDHLTFAEHAREAIDDLPISNQAKDRLHLALDTAEQSSLASLMDKRERLKKILYNLGVMDSELRTHQGFFHPYRILSMQMLDLYSYLEFSICIKSSNILRETVNDASARAAFRTIAQESRDYFVVKTAREIVRQFRLRIDPSLGERLSNLFGAMRLRLQGEAS